MRVGGHIILGGVGSIALYPFPSLPGLVFWLSSVVIDVDHYLDFIYRNGFTDFRIKKALDYHDVLRGLWRSPEFLHISVFHTVEFAALVYILSVWTDAAWLKALCLGIVFHVAVDMIYLYRHKVLTLRAYSVIEYLIRKNRLVARGLSPTAVYSEALRHIKDRDEK
jgi:hypothetical protein